MKKKLFMFTFSLLTLFPLKGNSLANITADGSPKITVHNNSVSIAPKPRHAPGKSENRYAIRTTGLIFVTFGTDIEDVVVCIYNEDTGVSENFPIGFVMAGSVLSYDFGIYGSGNYDLCVSSNNEKIFYTDIIVE